MYIFSRLKTLFLVLHSLLLQKMYYRVFKEVYMRENKPFRFSLRNVDLDYRKQKHVFPH